MKRILSTVIVLLSLASLSAMWAQDQRPDAQGQSGCPLVRIEAERLPDLNIARSGHATVFAGGELTVVGGHTKGFVPTPTIEYFSEGRWRQVPMVYTHDNATVLTLRSGKVLIMGGCSEPLGIGQTFTAELYDPATHSTKGFGCLDTKRTLASAVELDSGRVLISGNWYHDDAIEMFDGKKFFSHVKGVAQQRVCPFILPISGGDALVIGGLDNKGEAYDTLVVDRLKGAPFHVALFDGWSLPSILSPFIFMDCCVGDVKQGDYRYLLPLRHKEGRMAIAEVRDTLFSLLPTTCEIPLNSPWEDISFEGRVMVDRSAGRGYLVGMGTRYFQNVVDDYRIYVLGIDYARPKDGKAPLTLYYTDPLPEATLLSVVLADNGDIILTGGIPWQDNFLPTGAVYRLHTGQREKVATVAEWMRPLSWLCIAAMLSLALVLALRREKKTVEPTGEESDGIAVVEEEEGKDGTQADDILLQRIERMMEQEKAYLDSELKITDVAAALGTNRQTVSVCINRNRGCSFTQFVNGYRIAVAKELLLRKPEMKMVEVYVASGFANETSFFRTFKALTGMTPKEWSNQR